jgi:hypothetical protein
MLCGVLISPCLSHLILLDLTGLGRSRHPHRKSRQYTEIKHIIKISINVHEITGKYYTITSLFLGLSAGDPCAPDAVVMTRSIALRL